MLTLICTLYLYSICDDVYPLYSFYYTKEFKIVYTNHNILADIIEVVFSNSMLLPLI